MWSVAEFDQQLRAAACAAGHPMPVLDHAPVVEALVPVVVSASRAGAAVTVEATGGGSPASGTGEAALALLGRLGVSVAADVPATLIVADSGTVAALAHLARTSPVGGRHEAVAAMIGWWLDRVDFPGGLPVADVVAICRTRWVSGADPQAEQQVATWLAAHKVSAGGGLLDVLALHRLVSAGMPLVGLTELADDTAWSFEAAQRAHIDGWDWRRPDTPGRAAVGLRARCDAADAYAAYLLDDARYRQRAACGGIVVTGTLCRSAGQQSGPVIECERMDARLRPGTDVTGWNGTAVDQLSSQFTATVHAASVRHGRLNLTLSSLGAVPAGPGDSITVMPAPPIASRQRSGRAAYRRLYNHRRSWISTGKVPTITRRPVPLDVLVAAAERDD